MNDMTRRKLSKRYMSVRINLKGTFTHMKNALKDKNSDEKAKKIVKETEKKLKRTFTILDDKLLIIGIALWTFLIAFLIFAIYVGWR